MSRVRHIDKVLDYPEYVQKLSQFLAGVPWQRKLAALADYAAYIGGLLRYVVEFFRRVRPLRDLPARVEMLRLDGETERQWPLGAVPGWKWEAGAAAGAGGHCRDNATAKQAAMAERRVAKYLELLSDELDGTVAHCRSRATKSLDELERETELENAKFAEDFAAAEKELAQRESGKAAVADTEADPASLRAVEDFIDEANYNKKNLPIGEDGKPMPVWLWHVFGLHKKYQCEICNHEYQGEKNFVEHFAQPRHIQGLSRLGISETAYEQYHLITTREAAVARWHALQRTAPAKRGRRDDEEIEDVAGTVMRQAQFSSLRAFR